ncbi:MAG TPA: LexA family transcriptional regulator [Thermotogota bacterium]|nr:LexA family transcriptional regulator [Thermotogota bacterium]
MNEFSIKLRQLREKQKDSQAHIAKILGVSPQMVSKLEMGKSKPSMDVLKALALYFGVSVEYLLGLEDKKWGTSQDKEDYWPLLGEIAAGRPIFAQENIIDYIPRIPGIPGDFCLITKGKSMEPIIMDKSIVIVQKEKNLQRGAVGVFIIGNSECVVKRFFPDLFNVVLQSENVQFDPIVIKKNIWEAECLILGRVANVILDVV